MDTATLTTPAGRAGVTHVSSDRDDTDAGTASQSVSFRLPNRHRGRSAPTNADSGTARSVNTVPPPVEPVRGNTHPRSNTGGE